MDEWGEYGASLNLRIIKKLYFLTKKINGRFEKQ
jgi:hypothetical protein